jgi:hypothetical protein
MPTQHTAAQARTSAQAANRALGFPGSHASAGFSIGNFYNGSLLGEVSRHELELLRYANLQALMILARG